jgi:hypothetical protein
VKENVDAAFFAVEKEYCLPDWKVVEEPVA